VDIRFISPSETHEWLLMKHYAKRIPCITDAFGLYHKGVLVGVCTFGIPASRQLCVGVCGEEYADSVRELNRLCIDDEARELKKNVASYFVGACLRRIRKPNETVIVVSYADTEMGHIGKVYQATNFLFTGTTKERTDISTGEGKHSRHYDKTIDYSLNRKKRSAKHRYVFFAGHGKNLKECSKSLKYPILPYPLGETKRYDASYRVETQLSLF